VSLLILQVHTAEGLTVATEQEIIEALMQALGDRPRRKEHVKRFQELVWANEDLKAEPLVVRVFRDLAYELDFFEPDSRVRANNPVLYGDDRLENEIRLALELLSRR